MKNNLDKKCLVIKVNSNYLNNQKKFLVIEVIFSVIEVICTAIEVQGCSVIEKKYVNNRIRNMFWEMIKI